MLRIAWARFSARHFHTSIKRTPFRLEEAMCSTRVRRAEMLRKNITSLGRGPKHPRNTVPYVNGLIDNPDSAYF
jgi:hypothetical protein